MKLILRMLVGCVCTLSVLSQGNIGTRQIVDGILEEKLRLSKSDFLKAMSASGDSARLLLLKEGLERFASQRSEPSKISGSSLQDFANTRISIGSATESEIHAAINPVDSNNIVCSAINTSGSKLTTPVYYTNDFGNSWKKSAFVAAPSQPGALVLGGGDPMFAYDASGKLYFSWIDLYTLGSLDFNMDMYWVSSTDGGKNWDRDSQNDLIVGGHTGSSGSSEVPDKQWMVCDLSDSPNRNNLYCGLLHAVDSDERVAMRVKTAANPGFNAESLRPTSSEYTFNQYSSIDCDDQGTVHMSFVATLPTDDKAAGEYRIFHIAGIPDIDGSVKLRQENLVSKIRFLTLGTGLQFSAEAPIGMKRVQPLPQIACDKSRTSIHKGNVYMVWTALGVDQRNVNGLDIYFSRSTDHGATWTTPVVVNDDNKSTRDVTQAYASITVNPDGVIVVCWYDFREDVDNQRGHYYMTYSFDGGKTFIRNFRVTSVETDFVQFQTGSKTFGMGEYNQVVASRKYAVPFWGDGRDNVQQIYSARIPITADPASGASDMISVSEGVTLNAPQPNPAADIVTITFSADEPKKVIIQLINERGDFAGTAFDGIAIQGENTVRVSGSLFPVGKYIVRLQSGKAELMQKVVFTR